MHLHFSDWYRVAGLEPNADWLPKRATVIEEYVPSATEIVDLACFFYQLGNVTNASISAFQAAFQKADPSFRMTDNDQELRVLAGAELADVFERGSGDDRALAILALVCATAQNLRKPPCVPEIPEMAAHFLRSTATERSGALSAAATAAFKAIEALGPPHDKFVGELRTTHGEVPVLSEEVNMLWWLFAGHSSDESKPWMDFSANAVPLMVGKELADLTKVLPGPAAALAFLDKAIKSGKPKQPSSVEIKDAVNDAELTWRKKATAITVPTNLQELTPMSVALAQSVTSPKNNDWLPAFSNQTGIARGAKLAPHLLAYQLYLERLLVRAWKAAT